MDGFNVKWGRDVEDTKNGQKEGKFIWYGTHPSTPRARVLVAGKTAKVRTSGPSLTSSISTPGDMPASSRTPPYQPKVPASSNCVTYTSSAIYTALQSNCIESLDSTLATDSSTITQPSQVTVSRNLRPSASTRVYWIPRL